jgi:hypothetical protein
VRLQREYLSKSKEHTQNIQNHRIPLGGAAGSTLKTIRNTSVDFDLADPSDCNYLKVELNTRKKVPIGGLAEQDLMILIVRILAAAYA